LRLSTLRSLLSFDGSGAIFARVTVLGLMSQLALLLRFPLILGARKAETRPSEGIRKETGWSKALSRRSI